MPNYKEKHVCNQYNESHLSSKCCLPALYLVIMWQHQKSLQYACQELQLRLIDDQCMWRFWCVLLLLSQVQCDNCFVVEGFKLLVMNLHKSLTESVDIAEMFMLIFQNDWIETFLFFYPWLIQQLQFIILPWDGTAGPKMYHFSNPDTRGRFKPYYNNDLDCPCGFNWGSVSQRAVCLPSELLLKQS